MGVKCLLCTWENLTLDPQHPSKKPGVAEHACESNTGEEGRDRLLLELAGWPGGQAVSVHWAHGESGGW